jgi:hypothetical protein
MSSLGWIIGGKDKNCPILVTKAFSLDYNWLTVASNWLTFASR